MQPSWTPPSPHRNQGLHQLACWAAPAMFVAMLFAAPRDANAQTLVTQGIDTYVTSMAKTGPDGSYGTETVFEWDGDDGGGINQALLYFDISQDILDAFTAGSNQQALLKLRNVGSGSSGLFHRMTVDWLTGPAGGDNVTFNSIPSGPGIEPGVNAAVDVSLDTGDMTGGLDYEFDVTADVLAWAGGEANFGWGIIPAAGDGNENASFESSFPPKLELTGLVLTNADFNSDGVTDRADFLILAENYGSGTTFAQGDINLSGDIDIQDFVEFREIFASLPAGAAAVPEPTSAGLLGLAGACIATFGFRRRR